MQLLQDFKKPCRSSFIIPTRSKKTLQEMKILFQNRIITNTYTSKIAVKTSVTSNHGIV